jgi:hypothetical protein
MIRADYLEINFCAIISDKVTKMNKKILFGFCLFINFILVNYALAVVTASVDRTSLGIGQSLTLTIDVSKSNSDPDLSSLSSNFDVLGASTNSQTSIVNGNVSSQKNYIVSLSPKNTGKQNIPAIKVGKDVTAPISIDVTQQSISELALQKSQIFIDTKAISKPSYIGVPFVYSMKLYYSVGLTNVSMSDINITGATIQQLGKNTQYSENLKGVNYQVLEQKFQITPNQSGNITIPPIRIRGATLDNSMENSFFSMSRPKPFSIASKGTTIVVKPIPVGITQDAWFPAKQVTVSENQPNTSTTIKLGQPITRTITVAAIGIPYTSIPDINLVTPNNVNAYPDKTVSNDSFSGNELLATKVFKVAYIPTQAGTITFPETSVKWWDITSGSLKTALIPAKTYTILNENGKAMDASTPTANQNQPLAAAKAITPLSGTPGQKNIWFYISIALAVFWLITVLIVVIMFKKKSVIVNDNSAEVNKLNNEKKAVNMVDKACKNKDVAALNTALIQWASLHFEKKIYTVLDIKDLSTNVVLNSLLDEFNQTLYRGSSFEKFDALAHEIDMFLINKHAENNGELKELYPK